MLRHLQVHQWTSNFFNSTYSRTEDEHGTIAGVIDETEEYNAEYNEQVMIAFNIRKGQWNRGKGKGKDKGGKKGDNDHNPIGAGKDKGQQPVVCYTCGRPGHTSPECYQKETATGDSHTYNAAK
eukprot:1993008-Amphidinium_carterae.1